MKMRLVSPRPAFGPEIVGKRCSAASRLTLRGSTDLALNHFSVAGGSSDGRGGGGGGCGGGGRVGGAVRTRRRVCGVLTVAGGLAGGRRRLQRSGRRFVAGLQASRPPFSWTPE